MIILLQGGQSPTVVASSPLTPNFLIPCVGTAEGLDVGGFILEWSPLHSLPHLPHQTMLESMPPVLVEDMTIDPL